MLMIILSDQDAVISNSVLVKENGQFLSGNRYEAMKDKAKMS